jgi:hypothetical protein
MVKINTRSSHLDTKFEEQYNEDGLEWFCIHSNCEFLFMQVKFYMVV